MNSAGIDISKGTSMITVMRPSGEVVYPPFEISHISSELSALAEQLKILDGEMHVVMEATGNYHTSVARVLYNAGLYVSVVNPMLVHDYKNNNFRRVKTDKKDCIKLANYGLDCWLDLPRYIPEEDARLLLKFCFREPQKLTNEQTMSKNNLISLLDNIFPGMNRLFTSSIRDDGHEKWVDFVDTFWHCQCVSFLSPKAFITKYQKWCSKNGYHFSPDKALEIHAYAHSQVSVLSKSEATKALIKQVVWQLKATLSSLAAMKKQMRDLASLLPEYPVVMQVYGVGLFLGPQLMAEIGDVHRFHSKKALVAFAGIDAPPNQSGRYDPSSRRISKCGSSSLRKVLFLVMNVFLQTKPEDEPVYQFMDKKRAEGKPYKVYMMASANKFLRIYYASVKAYLDTLSAD